MYVALDVFLTVQYKVNLKHFGYLLFFTKHELKKFSRPIIYCEICADHADCMTSQYMLQQKQHRKASNSPSTLYAIYSTKLQLYGHISLKLGFFFVLAP